MLYKQQSKKNRFESYLELEKIIVEEAPVIPLYYDQVLTIAHKNLKGFNG